ncbi:sortase, marine proteobacterial type [Gammaproteobacteria bacterium 42_54_T18]|nr:sortase, marine proteobacterial type [Gammaproteobacteria bacterium 42_54_T18]
MRYFMDIKKVFVAVLMVAGCWQLGQAGYLVAKAELAQHLLNLAWGEMKAGATAVKPWPWADTYPLVKLRLGVDDQPMIVLAGASGRNLAFAPAHVSGSVQPGRNGVSVIGGHRDTHFSVLQHAQVNDVLSIEYPDGQYLEYRVVDIAVVDSRTSRISLDSEQSMLALVACYPFDALNSGGPLRFVVVAEEKSVSARRIII